MLRSQSPLALVRDAYNAIFVHGDAVGSTLYYGRGAGRMPTARAVVADVIDMAVGRAQQTFSSPRSLVRDRPTAPPDAPEPGAVPLLPAVHDCRPAGRPGHDRPRTG